MRELSGSAMLWNGAAGQVFQLLLEGRFHLCIFTAMVGTTRLVRTSAPEDSHAQALSRLGKSSAGRGVVPGRETPLSGANPKPWFYEQREYALCCPTMYVRGRETSSHTSSVLQSYHGTQLTAKLQRQEATEQPKACKIWTPKNMIMSKKCLYPMI